MLRVLIGSQPVRAQWLGGTTISTVTHGALIALAVVSSSVPSTHVSETRATAPERITYVRTVALPAATPAAMPKPSVSPASAAQKRADQLNAPDLSALSDALSTLQMPDMAAPDLTSVADAWGAAGDSLGESPPLAELMLAKSGITAPTSGVYTEDIVERAVEPQRGNPKPRYPSTLAQMGIGGDFVVKFVVDSTGVVNDEDIEFPESMHRLFADAVRAALLKSRYLPAMFAGRAVPQLVIQEFRFKVPGR